MKSQTKKLQKKIKNGDSVNSLPCGNLTKVLKVQKSQNPQKCKTCKSVKCTKSVNNFTIDC